MQDPTFITDGNVLDGKAVAATIRREIAANVAVLKDKHAKVGQASSCLQPPVYQLHWLAAVHGAIGSQSMHLCSTIVCI